MTDLEQRLAGLRDDVAWPPTPDLAAAVAARVAAEPRPAPGRAWRRGPAGSGRPPLRLRPQAALAVLAVAAALLATLAAAPGVRARIADWLGIGAVRIERVERLPDVGPAAGLGLGTRTTLAAARRDVRVPVPTVRALGPPDAVYVDRRTGGATLVYRPRPGLPAASAGIGALLTVLPGGDPAVVKKLLGSGTTVESVDVDGGFGVFISGAAHVVGPPDRLAGNTRPVGARRHDVSTRVRPRARRRPAPRAQRAVDGVQSSARGRRRSLLRCAWRRLDCSRRTRLDFDGRVAWRVRGTCRARASRSRRRSSASSRLRAWLRASWATARITGPQRAITRWRCASVSEGEAATSKVASTREAVTFACWPPGPEERLVRITTSRSGIATSRVTTIGSSIAAIVRVRRAEGQAVGRSSVRRAAPSPCSSGT